MPITAGGRFSPVDNIVSPGVFTRENDFSQIAQGVASIGAAIVAPFPKGPGFAPTLISSVADLENTFGVADGVFYGPYTAKEYLLEQGRVTICRVGALTGYKQNNPLMVYAVPGTWNRSALSGSVDTSELTSFLKSSDGTTVVSDFVTLASTSSATSGVVNVTASVVVTFSDAFNPSTYGSEFYGETLNIGTVMFQASGSTQLYISSSIQGDGSESLSDKLDQSVAESTDTVSRISMSLSSVTLTPSSTFDATGAVYLKNSVFKVLRSAGGCGAVLYMTSGYVSGSFGEYDGTFTPTGSISSDPCVSDTSTGIQPVMLAVLANTQNATQATSTLSVPGFSSSLSTVTSSVSDRATSLEFSLDLSSSDASPFGTYQFSMDPASSKYITSVFGLDPSVGSSATQVSGQKIEAAYIYKIFEDSIDLVVANKRNWAIQVGTTISHSGVVQVRTGELMNFTDAYSLAPTTGDSSFGLTNAATPWITSQVVSPWKGASGTATPTKYDLFKIHTLSDGTSANTQYKIEISSVKLAGTVAGSDYGTFTLSVRAFGDTAKRPNIIETFQNLTLDPSSPNYIARRIGDRYNYITFAGKIIEFGNFPTLSKCIRVEMTDISYPKVAVPYGFKAYATPVDSNYSAFLPVMKYSKASTYAEAPGKYASGVMIDDVPVGADSVLQSLYPTLMTGVGVNRDNAQYFAPLPSFGSNSSIGENVDFDLESDLTDYGVASGNGVPSYYVAADEAVNVKKRKFVVGMQGGFDGQWPAIPINVGSDIVAGNTQGLNCATISSAGSVAYKQCLGALSNADEFDINMIVVPGIFSSLHSYVTNLVVDICEARGDCFFIMDNVVFPASNQSTGLIDAAVAEASQFDTNYAATYYPWIKILDTNLNKLINVPPSVVLPAVYAANDKNAAEWYAPAGLTRGGIKQAVQVLDRTTHADRDVLQEGRVNPIAAFPGQGISVWGQKTLQIEDSALNRVNVRRLLISLKKFIASTSKYLVFEPNSASTRNKFLSVVNPYLESVQQRSGLYAFQVRMNDKNNTGDLIDRGILYGRIAIQPTRVAEEVLLDFNIFPTGAVFPTS